MGRPRKNAADDLDEFTEETLRLQAVDAEEEQTEDQDVMPEVGEMEGDFGRLQEDDFFGGNAG